MPGDTKIQWTFPTYNGIQYRGRTWNPMSGCDIHTSPGCDRCYAFTFAERFRGVKGNYYEKGFDFQLRPQQLTKPLKWKQPSCIFVNSMSDVFFEDAPTDYILKMFEVMLAAPQHIYQILTKRAPRMAKLAPEITSLIEEKTGSPTWPWNIWMGVTIESQAQSGRLKWLREVPTQVRFVSYEPALGPLSSDLTGVSWIIAGGESGSGARPIDTEWFREVQDHCKVSHTALFVKQMGSAWMHQYYSTEYRKDTHGGNMHYFPEDLRIREYPRWKEYHYGSLAPCPLVRDYPRGTPTLHRA